MGFSCDYQIVHITRRDSYGGGIRSLLLDLSLSLLLLSRYLFALVYVIIIVAVLFYGSLGLLLLHACHYNTPTQSSLTHSVRLLYTIEAIGWNERHPATHVSRKPAADTICPEVPASMRHN